MDVGGGAPGPWKRFSSDDLISESESLKQGRQRMCQEPQYKTGCEELTGATGDSDERTPKCPPKLRSGRLRMGDLHSHKLKGNHSSLSTLSPILATNGKPMLQKDQQNHKDTMRKTNPLTALPNWFSSASTHTRESHLRIRIVRHWATQQLQCCFASVGTNGPTFGAATFRPDAGKWDHASSQTLIRCNDNVFVLSSSVWGPRRWPINHVLAVLLMGLTNSQMTACESEPATEQIMICIMILGFHLSA